jgi:hypothetical protein
MEPIFGFVLPGISVELLEMTALSLATSNCDQPFRRAEKQRAVGNCRRGQTNPVEFVGG